MVKLDEVCNFRCGGRSDNALLQSAFLTPVPAEGGYTTLYAILKAISACLTTEATYDPATLTFNAVRDLFTTQSNVLKIVAPF